MQLSPPWRWPWPHLRLKANVQNTVLLVRPIKRKDRLEAKDGASQCPGILTSLRWSEEEEL